MFMKVTFLILLTRFPYKTCASRVCFPNSQSVLNGKICHCSNLGHWLEPDCYEPVRRQTNQRICTPGQVVFQGCNRCVCLENGQLTCTEDAVCSSHKSHPNLHESLTTVMPWCNPYRTYYFKCNICICPATGKSSESHCATDTSCTLFKEPSLSEMIFKKTNCIPTVMYLFSCLHCLCSDEGHFRSDKCVKTCVGQQPQIPHRCKPKSIYRKDCNVCFCPETGISDNKLCTNVTCAQHLGFEPIRSLRMKQMNCTPYTFTKPKCVYCECDNNGKIDEKTCLKHECLGTERVRHDHDGETCIKGEVATLCTECFCSRNGTTYEEFCSKTCTLSSKLKVLENVVVSPNIDNIIDTKVIESNENGELCNPQTVYLDKEKYCLCPETGISNVNFCKSPNINIANLRNKTHYHIDIDFNSTCEPSTFVEFDCNTCYCSKNGKIDPNWCTYDDCESKGIIQKFNNLNTAKSVKSTCKPGSISNVECNFCICPENGTMESRICTKNNCESVSKSQNSTQQEQNNNDENFVCEPLTYYEVDCNICLCPRDGIKNVAKCTKNACEKSLLRSDGCIPGQLFSTECNVCVCPPNGNIAERACTSHICDTVPWNKIFQLSESLLGNQITEDETRKLDHCFPGEEYFHGCELCVCPDMGMRSYAICSPLFCDEDKQEIDDGNRHEVFNSQESPVSYRVTRYRKLSSRREDCTTVNYTTALKRKECTPGSTYIVGCKQCVCPLRGDMRFFCRPMPKGVYCEQIFPGIDYVPMGRRTEKDNSTAKDKKAENTTENRQEPVKTNQTVLNNNHEPVIANQTVLNNNREPVIANQTVLNNSHEPVKTNQTAMNSTANATAIPIVVQHEHTRYECKKHGHISDECYMCECDGQVLIAEHCYKDNSTQCVDATPTFLQGYVTPDEVTEKPNGVTKKP